MAMLPSSTSYETVLSSIRVKPSKTYKLDFENNRIIGLIESDDDTLYQYVRKALSTDKYTWSIYDWLYGNEIYKLAGKDYQYIVTTLPDIINRALLTDDRVKEVKNYKFKKLSIDMMEVSFDVYGINNSINFTMEVSL